MTFSLRCFVVLFHDGQYLLRSILVKRIEMNRNCAFQQLQAKSQQAFHVAHGAGTVVGPVPIIVANAVAVPMTYCFDIVIRSISFTTTSLLGAVIVVVSFVLLNLHEQRLQSLAAKQRANVARLRREHTLETNLLLETSPTAILRSFDMNPYGQNCSLAFWITPSSCAFLSPYGMLEI